MDLKSMSKEQLINKIKELQNENNPNLFQLSPFGITIINKKGIIISNNINAKTISGYSNKTIIGKHFTKLKMIRIKDIPKLAKLFISAIKGQITNPLTVELKHKNGRPITAEVFIGLLKKDNKIEGLQVLTRDISEQIDTQARLKESNEKYESIFKRSNDIIYIHDLKGNFLDANDAALKALEYNRKDIKTLNIKSLIGVQQMPKALKAIRYIIKHGADKEAREYKLKTKTGNYIYVELKGSLIYHDSKPYAIQGIARDITERKNTENLLKESKEKLKEFAERSLAESEGRFEAIIKNSEPLIFLIDKKGIFTLSEGKGIRTLNLKPGQLVGKSVYKMCKDYPTIIKGINTALKGRTYRDTVTIKIPNKIIHFEFFLSPYRDMNNKIIGLSGMAIDITKLKATQQQLIQSEKISAIGQLASGIAHEFNNLLAIMSGNTEYALSLVKDEQIKNSLLSIEKAINKGETLVQDLRIFSKPKELNLIKNDIVKVINEVILIQQPQLTLENIKVIKKYEAHSDVSFDWGQMEQVFSNLFINAQHAIRPKKKGTIKISVKDIKGYVQIKFSDNGTGIDEDIKEKIFEPFFTTKSVYADNDLKIKGTGLGLSVTSTIIEQHNGTISVQSKKGKGATFIIELPIARLKRTLYRNLKGTGLKIKNSSEKLKKFKILIIDDKKEITDSFQRTFSQKGFKNIKSRNSAEKALQDLKTLSPDIIFLDLQMPGVSGEDFLKKLHTLKIKTPVILLSGKSKMQKTYLLDKRVKGFITKPFKTKDIIKALNQVF